MLLPFFLVHTIMSDSPLVVLAGITGFLATHRLDTLLADPAQHHRVPGTLC